ncbi:tRNA (5-methylaminomethyl-2-thiouridylate)-methyltransferase [Rhizobiales bacterium GAS191]|nr:tRNA (5-methylaminomethyl-2-thiouridylate)-methyltransferase [Rhizobiales bacterium GAS113]SED61548.1 tRNA (5-methylaminomethyl-2-thiouridylate)-methyltransferase [Rhizobiales bacterium GAS191]SEE76975.1 tRNA (5-methylaminomethyl-2-thiouridylate)-methyltransferase [Rhizobiales bacterium GAS188]
MNSLDLPTKPSETRVVVAMSGGVDSSVVAALLKEEGYDVVGVTLQLYDHGAAMHRVGACCAGQDIHDARKVASKINIPHYVLDYEDRFKTEVVDRFADDYLAGRTPIPCVECNRSIKFRDLLGTARDLGAAALATGHYLSSRSLADGRRALYQASDASRDQSYFLYATTPAQLDMLRFPLGDRSKAETRALAARFGLAVAEKADSQDICFVPTGRYVEVIEKLRPGASRPGAIIHVDGRVLGQHRGVMHYTVGQRKGLGVADGEPLYVLRLDAERAEVIVGPRSALEVGGITLSELNWLGDLAVEAWPENGLEVAVKVRSTRPPRKARLDIDDGVCRVRLGVPEEGVAPGQACVIYDSPAPGARLLGGGVIAATSPSACANPRERALAS